MGLSRLSLLLPLVLSLAAACDHEDGGDSSSAGADAGAPSSDGTDAGASSSDGTDATDGTDGGGGDTARTGLEGMCDHAKECGSTYYETAQDCIDASLEHWGECRRPELDAFGDCIIREMKCDEWNPDAYNPANTPCDEEWRAIKDSDC